MKIFGAGLGARSLERPFSISISHLTIRIIGLNICAYPDLSLDQNETKPFAPGNITLTAKNSSGVAGTEAVQLYIKDRHVSMIRPVKEPRGFAIASLYPGEALGQIIE